MENYFEMVHDANNCVSFGHSEFSNLLSTIQTKDDTHNKFEKKKKWSLYLTNADYIIPTFRIPRGDIKQVWLQSEKI